MYIYTTYNVSIVYIIMYNQNINAFAFEYRIHVICIIFISHFYMNTKRIPLSRYHIHICIYIYIIHLTIMFNAYGNLIHRQYLSIEYFITLMKYVNISNMGILVCSNSKYCNFNQGLAGSDFSCRKFFK